MAVDRADTQLFDGGEVGGGAVAFVGGKTVAGVLTVKAFHKLIPGDLGDNGGGGDRKAAGIGLGERNPSPLDKLGVSPFDKGDFVVAKITIKEGEVKIEGGESLGNEGFDGGGNPLPVNSSGIGGKSIKDKAGSVEVVKDTLTAAGSNLLTVADAKISEVVGVKDG